MCIRDRHGIPFYVAAPLSTIDPVSYTHLTGEEPYTLAIILDTLGVLHSSTIHAGDFDEDALSKAKLGIYPDKSLVNIPDNIKSKY